MEASRERKRADGTPPAQREMDADLPPGAEGGRHRPPLALPALLSSGRESCLSALSLTQEVCVHQGPVPSLIACSKSDSKTGP